MRIFCFVWKELNKERGRENLSFPVKESIENRGFSKSEASEISCQAHYEKVSILMLDFLFNICLNPRLNTLKVRLIKKQLNIKMKGECNDLSTNTGKEGRFNQKLQ